MARSRRPAPPPWPIQEIPYRFSPHTVRSENRGLLGRVATAENPSPSVAVTWMLSDDEAVATLALERFAERFLSSYVGGAEETLWGKEKAGLILKTAMGHAQAEGVLWNPVIDRLLAGMAPYSEVLTSLDEDLLRPLETWVRAQPDAARLHPLWDESKSARLRYMVSQATPVVDERFMASTTESLDAARQWVWSPALTAEQGGRMLDWALSEWPGWRRGDTPQPGKSDRVFDDSPGTIIQKLLMRFPPSAAQLEQIMGGIVRGQTHSALVLRSLLEWDVLESEHLEALWARASESYLELLAAHPGLNAEQAVRIVEMAPNAKVQVALAKNESAIRSAVVQDKLMQTRSVKTLKALLAQVTDPSARRRLFRRMYEVNPEKTLEDLVAGRLDADFRAALSRQDLARVLRHPDQSKRMLGIQAMGHLEGAEPPRPEARKKVR